jgi:hypothetical protein
VSRPTAIIHLSGAGVKTLAAVEWGQKVETLIVPGKTPQASFRLDAETVELLDALVRKWGLTRTAVIKLAVRRAAEAEGVRPTVRPETPDADD